jgi:hypothetical protein
MVTESDARKALDENQSKFQSLGAHSFAVIKIERNDSFAILIFAEGAQSRFPRKVVIHKASGAVEVPVIVEKSARFMPE